MTPLTQPFWFHSTAGFLRLKRKKGIVVKLISIPWDQQAELLERPNRFLAIARPLKHATRKTPETIKAHVCDPGRLRELLFPGNKILLRYAARPGRKTDWDLIAARYGEEWILVNSGFHSAITKAVLNNRQISPFGPLNSLRSEVKYGNSRLDFLIRTQKDEKIYIEVKGCTLVRKNTALFPDAPTIRGRRHLEELMCITQQGYRAAVIFLILGRDSRTFRANSETDRNFAKGLYLAHTMGVEIYPLVLGYREDIIWYKSRIPVIFD